MLEKNQQYVFKDPAIISSYIKKLPTAHSRKLLSQMLDHDFKKRIRIGEVKQQINVNLFG